jgi:putative ABC transport system ATP-binding protein
VPEAKVTIEAISVAYGAVNTRVSALENVCLDFSPGTLTLIMGPSGSGKTTLLTVLGCLLRPDSGRVVIGDVDVTQLSEIERTEVRRIRLASFFRAFVYSAPYRRGRT